MKKNIIILLVIVILAIGWWFLYDYFNKPGFIDDLVKEVKQSGNIDTVTDSTKTQEDDSKNKLEVPQTQLSYWRDYFERDFKYLTNVTDLATEKILDNPKTDYRATWLKTKDFTVKFMALKSKNFDPTIERNALADRRMEVMMPKKNLYEGKVLEDDFAPWTWYQLMWVRTQKFSWIMNWYDLDLMIDEPKLEQTRDTLKTVADEFVVKDWFIFACRDWKCKMINSRWVPFDGDFYERNVDKDSYNFWFFLWHAFRVYNLMHWVMTDNKFKVTKIPSILTTEKWLIQMNCVDIQQVNQEWDHLFSVCLDDNQVPVFYRYVWKWWDEFPWFIAYWELYLNDYELLDWNYKVALPWQLVEDDPEYWSFEKELISNYKNMLDIWTLKDVDLTECNWMTFDSKIACQWDRYINKAKSTRDKKYCDGIVNDRWRYYCYLEMLKLDQTIEADDVCRKSVTESVQDICYFEWDQFKDVLHKLRLTDVWPIETSIIIRGMIDRNENACEFIDREKVKSLCKDRIKRYLQSYEENWFNK